MKLILLIESSVSDFKRLIASLDNIAFNERRRFIDTTKLEENPERNRLTSALKSFSNSEDEILLARFSGKEDIVKELGDDNPQMLLCLSCNKDSSHYTDNIQNTTRDIITMLRKGESDTNIVK